MKTIFELECIRHDVTPAQFFAYLRQQAKRHGFTLATDRNCFERGCKDGSGNYWHSEYRNGTPETRPCIAEICKCLPYDSQTYIRNHDGSEYNEIIEFTFNDDGKTGTGYYYTIQTEAEAGDAEKVAEQEARYHARQASTAAAKICRLENGIEKARDDLQKGYTYESYLKNLLLERDQLQREQEQHQKAAAAWITIITASREAETTTDTDTETTTPGLENTTDALTLEEKSPAQEASEGIARYHANEAGRIAVEIYQLKKAIRESDDEARNIELAKELEQAKQELEYHRQAVCKWTERAKTGSTAATDTETDDTETRAEYPAIYEAEGKQIEEGATLYHIDPDNPLDYLSGKVIEIEPALNQAFITIQTPRGNLADYYQTFSFEPPAACGYWRSCLNL